MKFIQKLKSTKVLYLYFIAILLIIYFLLPQSASAADVVKFIMDATTDGLLAPVNGLMMIFKTALSWILLNIVTPIVSAVMSYNNFFTNGVNTGWRVTRDFANLFFALVLLIIAIATVLNAGPLDNYTAKRTLPIFIMVALLINFSKAIVGFFIDISQIIMVELWNAIGGGDAFKKSIMKASNLNNISVKDVKDQIFGGVEGMAMNLVAIIIIIIFIFIFLWTIVILINRIANIWISILLSPLAFMSFLIPGLRELYTDWLKRLQGALVTGPILMFMLYLSVTVMNSGFPDIKNDANLLSDGNMLTYLLVIILLFASNAIATKAGMEAPPLLQKAVGVAGTIATFGAGAYVGAGGYGTKTMLKTGAKGTNLLAGGATNVAGAVGGVTGIKALQNANQKYESLKRDLIEQQKTGVLGGKSFGAAIQGFSAEGKKQQLEDFEKEKALRLYNQNQLDEKGNERYKKIAATLQATAATEVKDEYNVTKLGEQMKSALEEGDKFTAMAIATRISELKGWNKIFTEGEYSRYSDPSNGYDTDAKQLDAFINDNFEIKDSSGAVIDSNKTMDSFRSRQANILNDKGAGNFAAGLAERKVSDPNLSPSAKAAKAGLVGAGDMVSKNNSIFNIKSKVTDSSGREIYEDHFDISKFAPIIANESSLDNLEDPKSWNKYGGIRANIIKEINNYLSLYQLDPALASTTYPALSVPEIGEKKLRAALKGLGGKNRITSSP